ncbi:hypothetical protein B0H16DRAFT_1460964 [Mycena metata]|uniref:Thioesterase domain-containing protein n=1 Tax=Mycena metata TaxID=1033252 RepID=A0AAD7N820_9AGAR|nr:hypothetical protein B0H16DRAFT_1460964 [Mycena metata]
MSDPSNDAVRIFSTPLPEALVSQIKGNAPYHVKEMTVKWLNIYHAPQKHFGGPSTHRTITSFVEILDGQGKLSTAFTIAVMDEYLSSAVTTHDYTTNGLGMSPVSLGINSMFYHPAELGAKLRFISTTQAVVAGRMTSRCEVWDLSQRRLVATGIFLGLTPSLARL